MKLAFIGDIGISSSEFQIESGLTNELRNVDIVVGNLEGVISFDYSFKDKKKYGSCVLNDSEGLKRLVSECNITHLSIFNNHFYDYGETGLLTSLDFIRKNLNVEILCSENNFSDKFYISNSGLVERFHLRGIDLKFGTDIFDILEEDVVLNQTICLQHFGVEMVKGLTDFELNYFDKLTKKNPLLIVRHHPHCVQQPFVLNGVPVIPSLGDFIFTSVRNRSEGLIVFFNTETAELSIKRIFFSEGTLRIGNDFSFNDIADRISTEEKSNLINRYYKDYRLTSTSHFKSIVKKIFGLNDNDHLLEAYSTCYTQPYIIKELFKF
jgi:hypothetical protein